MKHTTDHFNLRHEILILDTHLSAPLDETRQQKITKDFVVDALAALGMSPLGELNVFPATDLRAPGWSFVQPITTSHLCGHYFLKPGRDPHLRLDTYSCESIDWQTLVQVCDDHFRLADWRANFIDRQIEQQSIRPVLEINGFGANVNDSQPVNVQVMQNKSISLCGEIQ